MISSSLALYYSHPDAPIEIKKTCIRQDLRPTEVLVAVSALELTHFDVKLKKFSQLTRSRFAGRSFSGKVISVGSLVEHLQPGDRVCGCFKSLTMEFIGTYTIFDTARHIIFPSPQYLSDFQATEFPLSFGTAWELAFNRTPSLARSSKVLVVGGGTPIGYMLIQLLQKLFNLNDMTVVCSASSVEQVRDLGIAKVIDDSTDLAVALKESIGAEDKYTAIYDCIGGYDSISVWPSILKDKSNGGVYLTIRGDAPGLNKSESAYSLIKNAAPYVPRNVARLALGKFTGIDYHFVTWTSIPANAIDYATKTEFKLMESRVWTINDAQQALEYLKSLESGARVVIDMTSTPEDVQELGSDCAEDQLRYSEYFRYGRLKRRLRSSIYRPISTQEPIREQEEVEAAAISEEQQPETETPAIVMLSPEIDLSPEQTPSEDRDDEDQEECPANSLVESGTESTKESFNTKFKRMFKKKGERSDKTPSPKPKTKFTTPRWLGGKKPNVEVVELSPESPISPDTLGIIVEEAK